MWFYSGCQFVKFQNHLPTLNLSDYRRTSYFVSNLKNKNNSFPIPKTKHTFHQNAENFVIPDIFFEKNQELIYRFSFKNLKIT